MMENAIVLKGVRTHNLKNVDVAIPHGTFTVVTGLSGSGKSSLAFDTLYAEGRRRYVESLSSYSRQFLERIEKPDLDFAGGILPAIAIEAKNIVTNARSTVGTQTELNDYLRLLFARIGVTYCYSCGKKVQNDTSAGVFQEVARELYGRIVTIAFPLTLPPLTLTLSPKGRGQGEGMEEILEELERQGFLNFVVDEKQLDLAGLRTLQGGDTEFAKSILVIADQLELKSDHRARFQDSIESAFKYGKGFLSIAWEEGGKLKERRFSNRFHCADCNIEYRTPTPNTFSFNNPLGACSSCQGFGRIITIDQNLVIPNPRLSISEGVIEPWTKPSTSWEFKQLKEFCRKRKISVDKPFTELKLEHQQWILEGSDDKNFFSVRDYFDYLEKKTYKMHVRIFLSRYRGFITCSKCQGTRLKKEAANVRVNEKNIAQLSALTISALKEFFDSPALLEHDREIAEPVLIEIKNRLSFLVEVGLGYLTLDRLSRTLSGGEAQRIHLAASLGSALVDTLYVLDEPSVGLHERDNILLIRLLQKLKKLGNTVVVVEHDRVMIESADQIIDLGPFGGERGGNIVYDGSFSKLASAKNSFTAQYFRKEFTIERRNQNGTLPTAAEPHAQGVPSLRIYGAREHNLKNISVEIPLHQFVVITGVSGSGKSTLLYDVLHGNYLRWCGRPVQEVGRVQAIDGWDHVRDVLLIDQSPIGRTPRSNPVTYVKAFDQIRKIFAETRDAKFRRLSASHFSFNVDGGRCEKCKGDGAEKVEMHFLADIRITCEACGGSRYQPRTLEVRYKGKNISDVLSMTVDEALEFFRDEQRICEPLGILAQVGLGYLQLGQSAITLSGGEAQRLKLAAELSRSGNENLLYLFDEPTTGLHYYDIRVLLGAFETLLTRGHSICVIEHNMEVIKCADYVIDLGPEGGETGGELIYQGSLQGLLKEPRSHTGKALKQYFLRS